MRARVAVGLLVAVLLVGAACQADEPMELPLRQPAETPSRSDSRIIGLVGTMSGPQAWKGDDAFEGADVGVHVLNRGAAEDHPRFELLTFDDGGDPATARSHLEELAGSDRTMGIIFAGPLEALDDIEPVLAESGVPVVVLYGDLYSARRLTPHLFQSAPAVLWQARRIAPYLVRDRRYRSIGVVTDDGWRGQTAWRALRAAFPTGATSLTRTTYEEGSVDVAAALEELGRKQVEALVVQGDPELFFAAAGFLGETGAGYRGSDAARVASADKKRVRRKRRASGWWHPQIVGLDAAMTPMADGVELRAGTIAAASYARGVHYLPIPALRGFRETFVDWWGHEPAGWQQRSYEAARLIGRGADNAKAAEDVTAALERVRNVRYGGGPITLGPDDHTLITETHVGLWTVPAADDRFAGKGSIPPELPWVPLSRGFSIDGDTTTIPNVDWRPLFRNPPPPGGRAPSVGRLLYGISTPRSDPLH